MLYGTDTIIKTTGVPLSYDNGLNGTVIGCLWYLEFKILNMYDIPLIEINFNAKLSFLSENYEPYYRQNGINII